jgi:hypothetical protein
LALQVLDQRVDHLLVEDAVRSHVDPRPEVEHVVDLADPGPTLEVLFVVLAAHQLLEVLALGLLELVDALRRLAEDLDGLLVCVEVLVERVHGVVDDRLDRVGHLLEPASISRLEVREPLPPLDLAIIDTDLVGQLWAAHLPSSFVVDLVS